MERKELLLNLLFFIVTLPIVIFIFKQYTSANLKPNEVNYSNPLNLEIVNAYISENSITLWIYNPNNFTVTITANLVGVRNSFGSVGPITSGGDLGTIKVIPPKGTIEFIAPLLVGSKPKIVVEQWRNAGGNLTITLYYTEVEKNINGLVSTKLKK